MRTGTGKIFQPVLFSLATPSVSVLQVQGSIIWGGLVCRKITHLNPMSILLILIPLTTYSDPSRHHQVGAGYPAYSYTDPDWDRPDQGACLPSEIPFLTKGILLTRSPPWVLSMVHILDVNSEIVSRKVLGIPTIGAHIRSDFCYLIWLRHLTYICILSSLYK